MKWRCEVCGYIHEGDSPPDICPVCGVDASNFVKVEEEEQQSQNKAAASEKTDKAATEKQKESAPKEEVATEEAIKKAVRSLSYGLFIITAEHDGKDNGQTANTCFQITSDPVQVAIGINKNNYTHELITGSGRFGIAVLDQEGHNLARTFGYRSGREVNKFEKVASHRGASGVLLPDQVLATMEAEVVGTLDTGTHTLFLGKVTAAEVLGEGEPMTYAYFRTKK